MLEHILENALRDLKTMFKEGFISIILNNYEEFLIMDIYIKTIKDFSLGDT